MAGLQDLLSWMDSKRRLVGRNLSDLIQNPAGVFQQIDDQAKNYNQTVTPVAQGGSLYNRPMTEAEKDQRSIDLALNFGPMGVGTVRGAGTDRHWLRFGDIPEDGISRHVATGMKENGTSVMAPLDELGNSSWSPAMIFSMTAGEMGTRPLKVVSGRQLDPKSKVFGEGGLGSDGEPLISGAKLVRDATPLERHLLVKNMADVAVNQYGYSPIPEIFKLLNAEHPSSTLKDLIGKE